METQIAKPDNILDNILTRWKRDKSNLIEILQDVQERYRHIPMHIARTLAEELDVPLNRIFHIATFYKGFTLKPRGKHTICVCTGTACHVKGGTRILENIKRDLGVEEGGTTEDLLFSLESVRCVGCCGLAPVVTIDGEVYGNTSSVKVNRILNKKRKAEQA
ncbi:MAG: NAD(P)H-dependent oxidoreductase subunit E [candidate division Zixibacteria bacterium]|nr:NAD(P)H-dependent oxidoreductase subunit E [candidate division Zixibacteria bacterium]